MRARWQQTLVAAIGVTFSITMFITLLGFMNGLNEMLDGSSSSTELPMRLYNDLQANKDQPLLLENDHTGYAFLLALSKQPLP